MTQTGIADFDLRGWVGIRLLDARHQDVLRVERQLGPLQSPLEHEPDITIRFVESLELAGSLTYVGLGDGGFDDSAFYVLKGRDNVSGKARIAFQNVGTRCDIVCERRLPAVPLLLAIVNMTALAKGLLPLHSSAFVHAGRGVLAAGWAKGGKTETLLAFMGRGAQYVGDEWVYITPERLMFGIPEPIRLWRWQISQLPALSARLRRAERLRLAALDALASGTEALVPRAGSAGLAGSVLRRAAPVLRRQVNVQVPPARLFGTGALAREAELHHVLLLSSHEASDLRIEPVAAAEVAQRMVASNAEERQPFMSYYRQFRFAFPRLSSPVVERASQTEARLLRRAIAGLPASWLRHPYPPEINGLYERIAEVVSTTTDRRRRAGRSAAR